MYTSSLNELKKELKLRSTDEILAVCLRMARYKKENKELLHYVLIESENEAFYIEQVKTDIRDAFESLNASSFYLAKKTIRKVLRLANKQIRYSGNKQTEVEILLFFCQFLWDLNLPLKESKAMTNLLQNQLNKIEKALGSLHEDLQYDYQETLSVLRRNIETL